MRTEQQIAHYLIQMKDANESCDEIVIQYRQEQEKQEELKAFENFLKEKLILNMALTQQSQQTQMIEQAKRADENEITSMKIELASLEQQHTSLEAKMS